MIDVASGLCLDVSRTPMADGDDVVAAKCDRTGSQQWRVEPARGVIQSAANPDFCLDNRGDTDRPIGLGHCTAADDDHGADLTFSVHGDGSIRPAADWKTAVTPSTTAPSGWASASSTAGTSSGGGRGRASSR